MTHDISFVTRLVRKAGFRMSESLWEYWPCEGVNEISERNITIHLGTVLWESGFRLFVECHTKGSTKTRLDLMAYHPELGTTILFECKRLYSAEKCKEIADDIIRIRDFQPRELPLVGPSFGVVIATSWSESYAAWWSSSDGQSPAPDQRWQELSNELKKGYRGSVVINGFSEEKPESEAFQYMLYCVQERHGLPSSAATCAP